MRRCTFRVVFERKRPETRGLKPGAYGLSPEALGVRARATRSLTAGIVRFLARPGCFGLHSCMLAPRSRLKHDLPLRSRFRTAAISRFLPASFTRCGSYQPKPARTPTSPSNSSLPGVYPVPSRANMPTGVVPSGERTPHDFADCPVCAPRDGHDRLRGGTGPRPADRKVHLDSKTISFHRSPPRRSCRHLAFLTRAGGRLRPCTAGRAFDAF